MPPFEGKLRWFSTFPAGLHPPSSLYNRRFWGSRLLPNFTSHPKREFSPSLQVMCALIVNCGPFGGHHTLRGQPQFRVSPLNCAVMSLWIASVHRHRRAPVFPTVRTEGQLRPKLAETEAREDVHHDHLSFKPSPRPQASAQNECEKGAANPTCWVDRVLAPCHIPMLFRCDTVTLFCCPPSIS